eukprot:TRINITY_DN3812_c0_g1_i13.p1 TRINITY_DN3812_c0_g1~~TRINITY_DN3812_c0_g1_i13.p1  ORF type:complete len:266 (+),score=42.37 TRINITY_DN3812_c0_g1_i13:56-853(+)
MTFLKMSGLDKDELDEIFYSDEESSDSELFKANRISRYFSQKSESIFSTRVRQSSISPVDNNTVSVESVNSTLFIDSPINQISSGFCNLWSKEDKLESSKRMSYSAIMKKDPFPSNANTIKVEKLKPALRSLSTQKAKDNTKLGKVTESALAAGYRFKAKDPVPDPRYPGDQQLMVGPIPGSLEHDVIYNNLRSIFQSRGPVCFMFIHKSAVKDVESGNPVKFGYVVFAEKGIAQKVLKEGQVTFGGGHKIKVRPMVSSPSGPSS